MVVKATSPGRVSDSLLVINNEANSIELLDATSLERRACLPLRAMPHEGVVDAHRRVVYVCVPYEDGFYNHYDKASHYLEVVSLEGFRHLRSIDVAPHYGPHGIALTPDRNTALVTCESNGGEMIAIDLVSGTVTGAVGVNAHGPHWMTMLPDGSKVFTANKEDTFVTVVDVASMTVTGQIETPYGTEQIAVGPDGSRVFVASQRSPHLYVVDPATDHIDAVVELPEAPGAVAVTPDGERVLFTSFNFTYWDNPPVLRQGFFQAMDATTLTLGPRIPVGRFPLNVVASDDGTHAYVSNFKDNTVSRIDLDSMTIVTTASVGDGPHGLIYVAAPDQKATPA